MRKIYVLTRLKIKPRREVYVLELRELILGKELCSRPRDHHSNRIMEKELQNGSKMGEGGQRRRLIGTERVL